MTVLLGLTAFLGSELRARLEGVQDLAPAGKPVANGGFEKVVDGWSLHV